MAEEILRLEGIIKSYEHSSGRVDILKGVDLVLKKGEGVAIIGKSGSGKSTLLSVAALLDSKNGGSIYYEGRSADSLRKGEIERLRRCSMGFVFQSSLLLEDFSALENIMMPLLISSVKEKEARRRAEEMLSLIGLAERASHRPKELSGGERQRVAIARALVTRPGIIFADEPTGSLDEGTRREVENLLLDIPRSSDSSLLLVTHDLDLARRLDRCLVLEGGRLYEYDA